MSQSLAIKYRPKSFDDLTEQSAVVQILTNQIETNTIKHGYLFVGAAGTGKTTSARIFASMINKGKGEPIELDAASNNSVDDIRRITEEAQTKSLDSEYKIFIVDECHMLSNSAWNAFLKTLEEPPAKSIFILATTNPEKIPATILSRVQRYNFQRISMQGVIDRLLHILKEEQKSSSINYEIQAVNLIAKIADGGMRDAITLMDKCLSFSNDLTVRNVISALGIVNYEVMFSLSEALFYNDTQNVIEIVDEVFKSGVDLKQFIKDFFEFLVDVNVYLVSDDVTKVKIPEEYISKIIKNKDVYVELMEMVLKLFNDIKWEQNPKSLILATFILFTYGGTEE